MVIDGASGLVRRPAHNVYAAVCFTWLKCYKNSDKRIATNE